MNATTHPVSPEEVMALLDGELAAAEAQTIQTHIDNCAECASIAAQFRETSRLLSDWSIEPAPASLDQSMDQSMQKFTASSQPGKHASRRAFKPRVTGFGGRNRWVFGSIAAVAAILLVFISFPTMSSHDRHTQTYIRPETAMLAQRATAEQTSAPPLPAPLPQPMAVNGSLDARSVIGGGGGGTRITVNPDGPPAPMIARTVSMTIVVKDFTASRSTLEAILARHHGYSAQLTVNTPENASRSFQASLRIPAPELAAALAELKTLGRVENETQSGEEVTQQHADLEARLKTARDTEERFRSILQQRTGNVDEVLKVEEEIARVRGEIESMEAEEKALLHRVDFASVDLQLNEEYKAQLDSPAASAGNRFHNAFVNGYHNATATVMAIAIFLVEVGPTLLILLAIFGIPAWLIRRRYRKMLAQA